MSETSKSSNGLRRTIGTITLEVRDANPNGDPMDEGAPRVDPDNYGLITPQCIMRKMRDLIENRYEDESRSAFWTAMQATLELDAERYHILEQRGDKYDKGALLKEYSNNKVAFLGRYWDARMFGFMLLEEKKDREAKKTERAKRDKKMPKNDDAEDVDTIESGSDAGDTSTSSARYCSSGKAFQLSMGRSVCPIRTDPHQLTNCHGVESNKNQGMGMKPGVSFGIYVFRYAFDPISAHKYGVDQHDYELAVAAMANAYRPTKGAAISVLDFWEATIDDPYGFGVADGSVYGLLSPHLRDGGDPKQLGDYVFPDEWTVTSALEEHGIHIRQLTKRVRLPEPE